MRAWEKPLTLDQKSLLLISIPLIFDMLMLLVVTLSTAVSEHAAKGVLISQKIVAQTDHLEQSLYSIIALYVDQVVDSSEAPDPDSHSLQALDARFESYFRSLKELEQLTVKTPQAGAYSELIANAYRLGGGLRKEILKGERNLLTLATSCGRFQSLGDRLSGEVDALNRFQRKTTKELLLQHQSLSSLSSGVVLLFAFCNASIVAAITLTFVTTTTARLAVTRRLIAAPSFENMEPPVRGTDEIAQLDQAFRKMLALLANSRRRERAIYDCSDAVLCKLTRDGILFDCSLSSQKLFGYPAGNCDGQHYSFLTERDFEPVLKERTIDGIRFDVPVSKADGNRIFCSWSLSWSEELNCFICVITDISSRFEIEKELAAREQTVRALVEQMPIGVVVFDQSFRGKMLNRQAMELLELQSDDPGSIVFEALFSPAQCAQILNAYEKGASIRFFTPSSRHRTKRATLEIAIDSINGAEYVLYVRDVTARIEFESGQMHLRALISRQISGKIKKLEQFFDQMPGGTVCSLSQSGLQRVRSASSTLHRITTLVQELQTVELGDAGSTKIETVAVDIASLLRKSIESVEGIALSKCIELILVLGYTGCIQVDQHKILRVIENLLSNALKFSPAKTTVTVETQRKGEYVKISVRDEGCGIPDNLVSRIFDRFEQVEPTDLHGGAGLGLSICKEIVEAHQGRIWVESKPGRGSRFFIELPCFD